MANSWAGSFGFSYDALSRRTQMTRPNSITTNYSYDSLSRLLSVLHQASGSTIDGATYTVDNAGNRTSKQDWLASVTSNYTYDATYELTQATQSGNATESYTYDPVGNRQSSLGISPYSYNVSNELTSTPSISYTYDSNGNTLTSTTGSNTTSYNWDFENRLTSVTLPNNGGTVTFKYDPFGRRIYKSSSSTTSIFAYDGNNLVEEANSSGTEVASYSEGLSIDEPLAMNRSSAVSFYEADGLGSVTSLSSSAGALAQTYTRDSFGKQTASSGSLTNPFQYTAREFDAETNLYFYRARYYDPETGRFMNEDPIGISGGLNLYSYVKNSPINLTDATGLQRQKPKRPEVDPNAVFFVCCKKGQLAICENNLGQNVPSDQSVTSCLYEHEDKHLQDFRNDCPAGTKNFCADKPNNWPVVVDKSDQPNVECRGYCQEMTCLERKGLLPKVTQRKTFVEGQIKKFCGATGCPK